MRIGDHDTHPLADVFPPMDEFNLRGLADELLESKRVLPAAATEHGFGFKFPELEPALCDLIG